MCSNVSRSAEMITSVRNDQSIFYQAWSVVRRVSKPRSAQRIWHSAARCLHVTTSSDASHPRSKRRFSAGPCDGSVSAAMPSWAAPKPLGCFCLCCLETCVPSDSFCHGPAARPLKRRIGRFAALGRMSKRTTAAERTTKVQELRSRCGRAAVPRRTTSREVRAWDRRFAVPRSGGRESLQRARGCGVRGQSDRAGTLMTKRAGCSFPVDCALRQTLTTRDSCKKKNPRLVWETFGQPNSI
jgi:hypothetical protein